MIPNLQLALESGVVVAKIDANLPLGCRGSAVKMRTDAAPQLAQDVTAAMVHVVMREVPDAHSYAHVLHEERLAGSNHQECPCEL